MDCRLLLPIFLAWHLSCAAGWAQGTVQMQPGRKGTLPNLERVMVPSATGLAIGEAASWLAFVHERTHTDAHVSLVRLDAKGKPAAHAVALKLPKPAGLVKHTNYALSASFHPKLPLLYVWQDVAVPYTVPLGPQPPELDKFDHLVIYNVAKDVPELVASLCRDADYLYGSTGGTLLADAVGDFLYVPNVRDPKNPGVVKVGRFALDETGMPRLDDKDAKLPPPARLKRLAELNAAKTLVPHHTTPPEVVYLMPQNAVGAGFGFYPVSRDVILFGGWNGLLTWSPDDKRSTLSGMNLRSPGYRLLAGHPTLPIVFVTHSNTDKFARVEHGEGYVSQLPQTYVIPESTLFGAPAILSKSKKVAVGSRHRIYVADLDDEGRCRPELVEVPIFNPEVKALGYSERFDRLYVSVEVGK